MGSTTLRPRTAIRRRWLASVIAGCLGSACLGVLGAAPAQAANQDGVWNFSEFALWYNSAAHGYGSLSDWTGNVSNFGSPVYHFLSSGAGQGQAVKNNAASGGDARQDGVGATVFYNSGYSCAVTCQAFPADSHVYDLVPSLKNEDASFKFTQ